MNSSYYKNIITNRTILVYKKRNHITYKGYWIWGKSLNDLVQIIKEEVFNDLDYLPEKIDTKVKTLHDFSQWIKLINNIYKNEINEYTFYFYSNINQALKQVKANNSEIYVDYNKTFTGDCLKEE